MLGLILGAVMIAGKREPSLGGDRSGDRGGGGGNSSPSFPEPGALSPDGLSVGAMATETTYAAIVGQVLVFLRQDKGIRQADLAAAAGVGQSTWSRIETGRSALTVDQLGRTARALEIETGDIITKADETVAVLEAEGIRVRRDRIKGKTFALALIGAAALGLLVTRILRR